MESQIIAAEELAPDTGKPVSKLNLGRFGAGFIFFCIVFMMSGTIGSTVLLPARFNTLGIGQGETILGTMNSIGIIFALISNVIFGALSDASHSRFGKRTPWIIVGGPIAGLGFYLTSISPTLPTIVASWSLLQIGLNCMIAPCVAILSDRVPQKYRGSMSAFYGAGATIGSPIGTMLGALFIKNLIPGFAVAGVLMFLGGVVSMLIMPKEESADFLPKDEGSLKDVLVSFRPPAFHGAHDFYKAFVGRFCMLVSYQMIAVYQLYIIQNYIGQSVDESAVTVSVVSMIMMVMSLVGSFISGPVSDIIGRRKVPVVVASVLFAIGIAMPWVFPSSMGMYLFAGIAGLGYAVYSAVDQALLVDVLPNKEEAGKDLGILNMATTLGQMCGPIVMSALVVNLGYNFAFPTSIALAIIGCFFIMAIKKVK